MLIFAFRGQRGWLHNHTGRGLWDWQSIGGGDGFGIWLYHGFLWEVILKRELPFLVLSRLFAPTI